MAYTHDDNFPAGVINAVGESKQVELSAPPDGGQVDVRYAVDLEATAADQGGTVSDTFPSGSLTTDGATKEVTLSDDASDDQYTVEWDYSITGLGSSPSAGDSVEVFVETSTDGGGSWDPQGSKQYTVDGSGTDQLSFTDANVQDGDLVRVRLAENGTGEGDVDPDDVAYTSEEYEARIDFEVVIESSTDGGSSWGVEDTSLYEVDDTDGTGDSLSTSVTKTITEAGITDVRVRVSDITETGVFASQKHEADPNDCRYEATIVVSISIAAEADSAQAVTVDKLHQVIACRPDADQSTPTGWEDEGGATTDLYQSIDEQTPDDADYIVSP